MENEEESTNENLSKRAVDQKNATETEHRPLAESEIPTMKATSEEARNSTTNRINSSREETTGGNNSTLKRASASECYSKEGSDIGREDKSPRASEEDAVANMISVDQLGGSRFDGSEREIKSSVRIDEVTVTGGRRRQPFRDIIGKREQRREELERMEGDLRQRVDMLECSVPAATVWNIWRMAQGAPVCKIKRILERQFKDATASEIVCRSTPSRHYDCRVREVEAERKLALRKTEEARTLWTEKLATLEEKKRKLAEARRIQEEQKDTMERLNEEARTLRDAMEKTETDESCQYGECGDTRCKQRWLGKVSSVTSIESGDIQCLEKLQRLAEEEIIMKRDIAELECREEVYMRTLQQTDELWSKLENDTADATKALQERLDLKTAANQQLADRVCELEDALEKCRTRMAACRTELEKFLNIEKVEAVIGRDDDVAQVADKKVAVRAKVVHRPIGRLDDVATVKDGEALARVEVADERTLAKIEVTDQEISARIALIDADTEVTVAVDDKDAWIKPDSTDLAVDRQVDLVQIEDAESVVRTEDFAYEQQKFEEVREYLAKLGSLEELYRDDGEACPPDFVCNDEVFSSIGMTDVELITLGVEPTEPAKKVDRKLVVSKEEQERQFQVELMKEANDVTDHIEERDKKVDRILGVKTERKVVEKVEERIAEVVDLPVSVTATRRAIQEKAADDIFVTMPDDVRAPKVKEIEVDQGIVIQRDKILSWMDTIDTIRATIAKHPNCHVMKEDADTLAEMVGSYIGITPKEVVEEQDLKIVTSEDKQKKVIEKNGIKARIENEAEDLYQAKLDKEEIRFLPQVPTESLETDPVAKMQVEPAILSEITTETTKVHNARAEELKTNEQEVMVETKLEDKLMALEKKEAEYETKSRSIPSPYSEEASTEVKAPIESIDELLPNLTKEKISADIEHSKPVSMEDSFQSPAIPVRKGLNSDMPEMSEIKVTEDEIEKLEQVSQLDKNKIEIEETIPEIIETRENAETLHVTEIKEIEQTDAEEAIPTANMKEMEELVIDEIAPIVDLIEVKKFEPSELPIVNAAEVPTEDVIEEKIKVEETQPIPDVKEEKVKVKKLPVLDVVMEEEVEIKEPTPIIDIVPEKVEVAELPPIDAEIVKEEKVEIEEPSSIADIIIEEKIEIEEPSPIADIMIEERIKIEETIADIVTEEKIKIEEPPSVADIVIEKKIEIEKPSPVADIVTEEKIEVKESPLITDAMVEEKIEMIQPITEPQLIIKKEAEAADAIEEPALEIEITKERDEEIEEIPAIVTPSGEPPGEREEEELPAVDREEILAEIAMPTELMVPMVEDREEEAPLTEKKPEAIAAKEKVPIAEKKPIETTEIPAISIDSRLASRSYFAMEKIEERELLHIISATQTSCAVCEPVARCKRPPAVTAGLEHIEIRRTDVVQQTEIAEITTQAVSTAERRAPPVRIISEYLELPVPKASAEIAGDRPEITGRKVLWRERLKDQSTVTTASVGSQTNRTGHVSHDRVERERARVPTDELLRSIRIAAGLTRGGDAEREIRTINYGRRRADMRNVACNCCLCGKTTSSSSLRSRLPVRPRIDVEAATPAATAAFKRMLIPTEIDRAIPYDRLCTDCRTKIQDKTAREKHHIEMVVKKITGDRESCGCAASTGKPCRTAPRKRAIEKKDQGCLAKITKRRADPVEQKKKHDSHAITLDTRTPDVEPLSPSCICFKIEKTGVGPMRKGNCYCAD